MLTKKLCSYLELDTF